MNQAVSLTDVKAIDVSDPTIYLNDTWPAYFAKLRVEDPVHYTENELFGGFWSVTRYEDIVAVDSNHDAFSSEPAITIGDYGDDVPVEQFIAMDSPKHDVQRAVVQPVVAPKNLAQMEALIRSRVAEMFDALPVGKPFDWVSHVSVNLTTQMLATIFAFPFEDRVKLTYWSDMAAAIPEIAGGGASVEERNAAMFECLAYFTELWHARANGQSDSMDFITAFANHPDTKSMIDRPLEFLGNLLLLIVGGNDTTRNSLSGGVLALNENPDQFDKLKADHSLVESLVPEIIRWQTPLMHMRRIATRDVELGGKQIKKGDKVVMWYVSGNRDETAIQDADKFIIDRANPRQHLAFGFGIHRCMGNRLGEMQLRIVWEEILRRYSHVEVVGEPKRVLSNFVRGIEQMEVILHA